MERAELEDVISAAFDREPVDLVALRHALKTTEGRELLASFLLVRAAAGVGTGLPAATPSVAVPDARASRGGFPRIRRIPTGLAASLIALAAAGSFWLGTLSRAVPLPPVPVAAPHAQVPGSAVAAQPAGTDNLPAKPTGAGTARAGGPADRNPPVPTRVVRFGPAGWREGS